ncbi:hypothetical protein [Rothia kristinae]|uniref:hypothetical protein n=1 Tax=Rothia kristinae TaxID=37923 RepID=UPI0011A81653|nr:hypothetical protein [Rothia kristinae]
MAFKLFRGSAETESKQPRQRPADGGAGTASAAGSEPRPESGGVRALSPREELPAGGGLPELLVLMDRYGVRTLRLDQHGNEMTAAMDPSEKPERKTTVDTESTWFDAVASLYTAAQAGPRGPWRRAEIMVGSTRDGQRPVEVEYTYPGSERQDRSAYVQTVAQQSAGEGSGAGTAADADAEAEPSAASSSAATGSAPAAAGSDSAAGASETVASGAEGRPAGEAEVLGVPVAQESRDGADAETPRTDAAETASSGSVGSAAAQTASTEAVASGTAEKATAAEDPREARDLPEQTGSTGEAEAEAEAEQPVPAVVPDSTWDEEHQTGREHRVEDALPESAPSVAEHADVAPSYHAPAQAPAKPSDTRLAPGNLVLTEAQVVSRLTDAQQALFGPQGTARDVSTVLIRVRALGSYYDALTHVRGNGLWDQRSTFQLVPEEALQVLALKEDSYQEGQGSPIAMMFRFTPGIPPEVSFDYADEERYVQYRDRLPAQQYVEELRMYPRTGSNIPEHMNEALTQWSL